MLCYTVTAEQQSLELFLITRTQESFGQLCDLMTPRLMRYFRARSCDLVTAEELTQDVLFVLYRRSGTIRDTRLFQAWIYRVAHNALLQRLRSARRRIRTVSESDIASARWDGLVGTGPPIGNLDSELAALEERDRDILLLRFVDGLAYQEIASALHIPIGTAKWRVFNSKLKLAAQMRKGERK